MRLFNKKGSRLPALFHPYLRECVAAGRLIHMIHLQNVNKVYNKDTERAVHALRDVNLEIVTGEMVAITGPSGSGKSTLLHILSGIDCCTSGDYFFNGVEVSKMNDREKCMLRNKEIGLIMQNFGLLGDETVLRNICLPQIIGKVYSREWKQRAREMLSAVGLAGKESTLVNQLSGGQKQRVAIARALTMNAKLILADEPTGALDTYNTDRLMELLTEINRQKTTIVIVTHDLNVAKRCQRNFRLVDGALMLGC